MYIHTYTLRYEHTHTCVCHAYACTNPYTCTHTFTTTSPPFPTAKDTSSKILVLIPKLVPTPTPILVTAGLLDASKAAQLRGLIPAGPKDPTPDANRLEAERLVLAQDSALHKAVLSEVFFFLLFFPFFSERVVLAQDSALQKAVFSEFFVVCVWRRALGVCSSPSLYHHLHQ